MTANTSPFDDKRLWLAENDLAVVVDQPEPWMASPGHCLIVPRRHIATVWEMDRSEWLACLDLLDVMRARLDAERRPTDTTSVSTAARPRDRRSVTHTFT